MISKQLEWDYTYFLFVLLMAYFVLSLEKTESIWVPSIFLEDGLYSRA